jgi:hypothetical protein
MRDSWSGPGMATPPIDLSHGVEQAHTSIDFETESSLLSLLPAFRPKRWNAVSDSPAFQVMALICSLLHSRVQHSNTFFLLNRNGVDASFPPQSVMFPSVKFLVVHPTSRLQLGSVQSFQGTFGWVLATSIPRHILFKCSGPAYGACMDSYRAEAFSTSIDSLMSQ